MKDLYRILERFKLLSPTYSTSDCSLEVAFYKVITFCGTQLRGTCEVEADHTDDGDDGEAEVDEVAPEQVVYAEVGVGVEVGDEPGEGDDGEEAHRGEHLGLTSVELETCED